MIREYQNMCWGCIAIETLVNKMEKVNGYVAVGDGWVTCVLWRWYLLQWSLLVGIWISWQQEMLMKKKRMMIWKFLINMMNCYMAFIRERSWYPSNCGIRGCPIYHCISCFHSDLYVSKLFLRKYINVARNLKVCLFLYYLYINVPLYVAYTNVPLYVACTNKRCMWYDFQWIC